MQVWVPDFIKSDAESRADETREIRRLVQWHRDAWYSLRAEFSRADVSRIDPIHLITFNSHIDIAQSLTSAHILLKCGLLADALTVLRPAIEHMIDLQYLHRWPDEVSHYDTNAVEFLLRIMNGDTDPQWQDFAKPFRFKNITTVVNHISKQKDISEAEKAMIAQWQWLSNVAEHSSSMRVMLSRKLTTDWSHAIEHIGYAASLACEQIHTLNPDIGAVIDDTPGLPERYAGMVTSGIIREPGNG